MNSKGVKEIGKFYDPVEQTRKQMGYKNNWHRKRDNELAPQHVWANPMPQKPRVAIIGGGLSGLACAQELARLSIHATVFDTGKHSVGGRLATRRTADRSVRSLPSRGMPGEDLGSAGLVFDHAAQCFTATDPRFRAVVDSWVAGGAAAPWQGPVVTVASATSSPAGTPVTTQLSGQAGAPAPELFVGTRGMRGLAQHMEKEMGRLHPDLVEVRRPVWVGKMEASPSAGGWVLQGEGKSQGVYDFCVVAHNGKCANRLLGPTGAPRIAKQLMQLRLNAVWACMVVFKKPLDVPWEGAFIKGSPVLSWAASNTRKMKLEHTPGSLDCWTLISTAEFGSHNKVPQEAIPEPVQEKIAGDMLAALAADLGLKGGRSALPEVLYTRCQLWGAALPVNTLGVPCVVDPLARVGICGDWVLGSSMQAAVVSGITLAQRIASLRGVSGQEALAAHEIGLTEVARPLGPGATDIGSFPGADMPQLGRQQQQQQRPPQGRPQQQRPGSAAAAPGSAGSRSVPAGTPAGGAGRLANPPAGAAGSRPASAAAPGANGAGRAPVAAAPAAAGSTSQASGAPGRSVVQQPRQQQQGSAGQQRQQVAAGGAALAAKPQVREVKA